ncbi:hypothetical protein GCM10025787_00420 [Saccharopolyspora rosea]|uniref:LuxR C-terminal-related transcriptional regulator n=1 Tax=Saccharopolyspora rosea TaxID=524884 RepID=A0ABW3FQR8_9PSEU
MSRGHSLIEGRDGSLAVLRSALRSGAQRGHLVVVRGPAGIGKTALLEAAARRWGSQGVPVARVDGGTAGDRCGVDAVVRGLREDFDRFGDAGLIDAINALVRCNRRGLGAGAVTELHRVFGRIGGLGPAVVLIDDLLDIEDPEPLLLAARRPGCLVVAAVRTDAGTTPTSGPLLDVADEVLDLGPLDAEEAATVAGDDLDDSVHQALRAALGPLHGNPGTLLATLEALRERGRLVDVDGRLHLAEPDAPIALPDDHDLLRRMRRIGALASRLLAVVATSGVLEVDDLARVADELGEDLAACGRTLDRLVEEGLLVVDGWGRSWCVCEALAASASSAARRRRAGEGDVLVGTFPKTVGATVDSAAQPRTWSVTDRHIVELVAAGLTNRRIGTELGLSEKTVEGHLTRLFAESGCRSRVELVAQASLEGLLGGAAELGRPAA